MPDNLRVDLSDAPPSALRGMSVEPGDIFKKAGGPGGFWWIVAVVGRESCYALSLDREGNITGSNRYAPYYFSDNLHRRVGFVDIPPPLRVNWDPDPR